MAAAYGHGPCLPGRILYVYMVWRRESAFLRFQLEQLRSLVTSLLIFSFLLTYRLALHDHHGY